MYASQIQKRKQWRMLRAVCISRTGVWKMNSKIYRAFSDREGEQKIRDKKAPNHKMCPFYFEVLVHNAVEFVLPDDVLFAGCEHPDFGKKYPYSCRGQCIDEGKPYGS